MLTDTQQKRIRMYYFEEMKYDEIAVLEGCTIQAVRISLISAREKLVNILKTME
ncbi:MAG: sigma-70 region 4 domain-containing protein [Clostridia bacterium]|nr:sigma-70 region 4 domain-containing protein [Clostridia bacterium]